MLRGSPFDSFPVPFDAAEMSVYAPLDCGRVPHEHAGRHGWHGFRPSP